MSRLEQDLEKAGFPILRLTEEHEGFFEVAAVRPYACCSVRACLRACVRSCHVAGTHMTVVQRCDYPRLQPHQPHTTFAVRQVAYAYARHKMDADIYHKTTEEEVWARYMPQACLASGGASCKVALGMRCVPTRAPHNTGIRGDALVCLTVRARARLFRLCRGHVKHSTHVAAEERVRRLALTYGMFG